MIDTLNGRVTLVTGGGRGLGEQICRTLGEAGATVIAADIRMDLAENLVMRLHDQGVKAQALALDVGDERQAEGIVRRIADQHGTLDILINNAGTDVTLP